MLKDPSLMHTVAGAAQTTTTPAAREGLWAKLRGFVKDTGRVGTKLLGENLTGPRLAREGVTDMRSGLSFLRDYAKRIRGGKTLAEGGHLSDVRKGLRDRLDTSAEAMRSEALRQAINERKLQQGLRRGGDVHVETPAVDAWQARTQIAPGGKAPIHLVHPKKDLTTLSTPGDQATRRYMGLEHELGEREIAKGQASLLPFASHLGPRPILREEMALYGTPSDYAAFQKLRRVHGEDVRVKNLMDSMGVTPHNPMPIGGRQERALNRILTSRMKDDPEAIARRNLYKLELFKNGYPHPLNDGDLIR